MKCKFCNREQTHYCGSCNAPLCDVHTKRGRNKVVYGPVCNSVFYKPSLKFLEKVKSYCNQERIYDEYIYKVKAELHYYIDRYL